MHETSDSRDRTQPQRCYPARLLKTPLIGREGLEHQEPSGPGLLPWDAVRLAIAAEIGEPEGVRTIVFDLIVESEAGGWIAQRLDAEPGGDAMACARALARRLRSDVCGPSLKSLATDGIPSRWYPDLDAYEEAALVLVEEAIR